MSSKIIGIIDIWSHKIKVWICEILDNTSTLIWYWEKRQDSEYSFLWEYKNIEWICENIQEAISKAEIDSNNKIEDIIINFPFEEVFFCHKKLNHNRKIWDLFIDDRESEFILAKLKKINHTACLEKISNKSTYLEDDLKLILNNISNIKIDWTIVNSLINNKWNKISISLLDIYIPISKYNLLHYIWNVINKNILKIVPSEFSLIKLFSVEKDLTIIELWNAHTSIIVKKDNELIWVSKAPLWIDDLIKNIKINNNISSIEAINSIDDNIYIKEKNDFLNIFDDLLVSWIEDIIWNEVCPDKFFITWGGWNEFIKNHLSGKDYNDKHLKMINNIKIIELKNNDKIPWNSKITTNILSLSEIAPSLL